MIIFAIFLAHKEAQNFSFDLDDQIDDQRLAIQLFLSAEIGQGLSEKVPVCANSERLYRPTAPTQVATHALTGSQTVATPVVAALSALIS